MDSKYDPIRGLHVKYSLFKNVLKGEDAWIQKPSVLPLGNEADCSMDVFGVFDGHGGKQAALFAKNHSLVHLTSAIKEHVKQEGANFEGDIPEDLKSCSDVHQSVWTEWSQQQKLIESLPNAYISCFKHLQEAFFEGAKVSGTTSTVVSLTGWEVVVANVGDSCAFLDTGNEVLQISGNHRLEDNKKEQERISSQGFELSSSRIEGRPAGPLRVWPGGLAMGRTLGDFEAGDIVTCEPEIRQVSLPEQGGRIVIASDGLWDAVTPKTALHHIRGIPASKAARELVQLALSKRDLKDDVTVMVIDATPTAEYKLPSLLSKDGAGQLHSDYMNVDPVNVYHPLEDSDAAKETWRRLFWARRLAAVKTAFPQAFRTADEMEDLISGSLSETHIDSGDEVTKGYGHGPDPSTPAHTSVDQEVVTEVSSDGSGEDGDGWETVPERSKAVPVNNRKHPHSRNENSPSELSQAPKVMKEAPLSPAPDSLQASDVSSTRGSFRGRFRGRARGSGRGRGRGHKPREVHAAKQQIEGFDAPPHAAISEGMEGVCHLGHHVQVDCAAPDDGFSFMAGGGFSFQQDQDVPPGFAPLHSLEMTSENHSGGGEGQKPAKKRYWHNRRGGRRGRHSGPSTSGKIRCRVSQDRAAFNTCSASSVWTMSKFMCIYSTLADCKCCEKTN